MNATGRFLMPLFLLFLLVTALVFLFSPTIEKYGINRNVLLVSNGLLLAISILSFFIQQKGIQNKNPHAFVRSVTAGMMLKMVICIAALIIYMYSSGKNFDKKAVFISLFLYLLYLATEVFTVMKMNKHKKANG